MRRWSRTEPVFVNVYGVQESIPKETIPPAYVAWQAGTTNRVVVPARQAGNRFLGFWDHGRLTVKKWWEF